MSASNKNGMLIQPTENGFLVTEAPPPGMNMCRLNRYWVFMNYEEATQFIAQHFSGFNPSTLMNQRSSGIY